MYLNKKHKFTTKERDAINGVLGNLDELDNKPRRLYHALRGFATTFHNGDDHYKAKENHVDILISIDEAEQRYYLGNSIKSHILYNLDNSINNILREEAKYAYLHDEKFDEYATKKLLNKLASKIITNIFDA